MDSHYLSIILCIVGSFVKFPVLKRFTNDITNFIPENLKFLHTTINMI